MELGVHTFGGVGAIVRSIELHGTEVAPLVRDEVARRTATPAAANG